MFQLDTVKFSKATLWVFLALMFTGCQESQPKIAFLFPSEDITRFVTEGNFFAERARQLGAEVTVRHADNNDALQHQLALEFVKDGVDVLVLVYINANTAAAIVRDAKAAGVKVMAYNRLVPDSDLDMFVSGNNEFLGIEMANYVLNEVPSGNYMLFGGDKFDRNAVELQAAINNVLKPHVESGKINILYKTFIEGWSGTNAGFELNQFNQYSSARPDAIISCNDGMAVGMINILEDYGLAGKVIITGQDAELATVRNIVNGKHHLTLYHPFKETAYTAAELAIQLARGNSLQNFEIVYTDNGLKQVPTVRINSIPVTRDNVDQVLINGGVYTREQVYN